LPLWFYFAAVCNHNYRSLRRQRFFFTRLPTIF
jgi:hypothetical protein